METTAIRLTVFRQPESYIFSLDLPLAPPEQVAPSPRTLGDSFRRRSQDKASWSVGGTTPLTPDIRLQLNESINEAVERLQRNASLYHTCPAKSGKRSASAGASLKHLGQYLFNFLLPPTVQDALRDIPDIPLKQRIPIILTTNDTELPWELLHDGNEFLALKYPFARRLWSTAPLRFLRHESPLKKRSFLFIANPTSDLAEADSESDELIDLFEPMFATGANLKLLARGRADKLKVSQEFGKNHELIHYSGHAEPVLYSYTIIN